MASLGPRGSSVQGLVEFVKTLGASRIAAMGAVTIALIGFFAFLIMRVTTPQMTPLFTDLTSRIPRRSSRSSTAQAVPYELRNDGNIIMVPKDRVARLRMKLAEGGLPKGGGVGYEIFDKSDALGTTSFVQNINHLRALEGELARTIRALDRVQDARVHLVMPERPLFSRDKVEPSASIVLKVRGTLEPQQVRAIRHLVASAVNGLRPQRVSIVDEPASCLADGAGDDANGSDVSADERQAAFEKRLRSQVEAIVSSVVGPGHARVQVTADFDFNRITQTSDKFDPDRPRRALQPDPRRNLGDQRRQGQPGHGRQRIARRPAPAPRPAPTMPRTRRKPEIRGNRQLRDFPDHQDRSDRRRPGQPHLGRRAGRRHLRQERQGRKSPISRAARKSSTRSPRWCARRSASTRSAATRSRSSICALPRPPATPITEPSGWLSAFQFTKDDIMRAIEMVVMGLLGLVVLFMVVRPLVRRIITPDERAVGRCRGRRVR